MSNSPVGWAIRGVHAPSSTGLWARSCAPCSRGNRSRGAVFRVGTARNTGVLTETSVRRLCPPYEESLFLVSRFSFLVSPFSPFLFLLAFRFFICHPDEEMAERRRRPGACEAPVSACHDRHAGALSGALRSQRRDARLSALHRGDFRPGPVLAVVRHSLQDRAATLFDARVIVTRRSGSRGPPTARSQTASGDATPRSA
jgi:hypothetical protein